jgi:CopG family transcriptional regulator, nickel-responsive regulator
VSIISLSLPNELLEELDTHLGEDRGATRSEVVRQAVRLYLTQNNELEKIKGNIIATITVLYEKTEQNKELFRLQHEFDDMITAYLHAHLSETDCLEVMVIKGASDRLRRLIDGLKANKPVKQIKFSIMAINEKESYQTFFLKIIQKESYKK